MQVIWTQVVHYCIFLPRFYFLLLFLILIISICKLFHSSFSSFCLFSVIHLSFSLFRFLPSSHSFYLIFSLALSLSLDRGLSHPFASPSLLIFLSLIFPLLSISPTPFISPCILTTLPLPRLHFMHGITKLAIMKWTWIPFAQVHDMSICCNFMATTSGVLQ